MTTLLSQNNTFDQLVISASGTTGSTLIPEFDGTSYDEIVYQVAVENVTGTPTSWSLIPVFNQIMPLVQGQEDWFLQYSQSPVEQALNAVQHGTLLPDGDWPVFSSANSANIPFPVAGTGTIFPVTRRIRGGFIHRLTLVAVITGGTSPTLVVSVNGPNARG